MSNNNNELCKEKQGTRKLTDEEVAQGNGGLEPGSFELRNVDAFGEKEYSHYAETAHSDK